MTFFKITSHHDNPQASPTSEEPYSDEDDNSSHHFSFDLEVQCLRHFEFLKTLHDAGVTKLVTSESLRRYILWIKLLATLHQGGNLTKSMVPPKDVAWLWHCHRLAPLKYREFVEHTYPVKDSSQASILDWKDPSGKQYVLESNEMSRQTWAQYYPNEPFDLNPMDSNAGPPNVRSLNDTIHGFDLLASATSQAEFYWQIQPLFERRTQSFASAVLKYKRFMAMFRHLPTLDFKLVPTYEIDLIWHTHMTGGSANEYYHDCQWMCGKMIDHDDAYGGRDRQGVLKESFARTAELWHSLYQDDSYSASGGYRGAPGAEFFPASCPFPIAIRADCKSDETIDLESPKDTTADSMKRPMKQDTDETARINPKVSICLTVAFFFGVVGITLILLEVFAFHQTEYVCGSHPPSTQEIEARGAPVCLTTNVREGALCLQSGLDPSESSVWCQEDMANIQGGRSFYLWWSKCDNCATAWRMFRKQDDDFSTYRALHADQPESHEAPLNDTWTEWIGTDWNETNVEISQCALDDVNSDGIPNYCFAEKQNRILWIMGIVMVVLSAFTLMLIFLTRFQQSRAGGQQTSHNYFGRRGASRRGNCSLHSLMYMLVNFLMPLLDCRLWCWLWRRGLWGRMWGLIVGYLGPSQFLSFVACLGRCCQHVQQEICEEVYLLIESLTVN